MPGHCVNTLKAVAASITQVKSINRRGDYVALAGLIRTDIEALPKGGPPEDVVAVFQAYRSAGFKPSLLGDAFWELDSRPGLFPGYGYGRDTGWHARLRVCRNTPSAGVEMFSTFS